MSHRLNFISGVVMLVVAGTSVFFVVQRDRPSDGRDPLARHNEDGQEVPLAKRTESYERPHTAIRSFDTTHHRSETRPRSMRETKPSPREDLRVDVATNHPRRGELQQQARAVESYARRRLAVMTEELELTDEQQAKIFPLLVRSAQSYDPGMRVIQGNHASPLPTTEDPATTEPLDRAQEQELVQKELDGVQEDELIERKIGDLLIWEEIIGDLTRQLDTAIPGQIVEVQPEPEPERATTGGGMTSDPAVTPPASGGETTDPPDSRGGRNLFDEVDPGN